MAVKRSPRWSVAEATAALADHERSGLSIRAFCHERGWDSERLYRWKRRLSSTTGSPSEDATATTPSFVRAEVNLPRRSAAVTSDLPMPQFELVLCNGQRMYFPADADPAALARTVQALEANPC